MISPFSILIILHVRYFNWKTLPWPFQGDLTKAQSWLGSPCWVRIIGCVEQLVGLTAGDDPLVHNFHSNFLCCLTCLRSKVHVCTLSVANNLFLIVSGVRSSNVFISPNNTLCTPILSLNTNIKYPIYQLIRSSWIMTSLSISCKGVWWKIPHDLPSWSCLVLTRYLKAYTAGYGGEHTHTLLKNCGQTETMAQLHHPFHWWKGSKTQWWWNKH